MSASNHKFWKESEFQTYLLLYCANVDLNQSAEELYFIKERVEKPEFKEIQQVFNSDTDYQSLTRLQDYVKGNKLSKDDLTRHFNEVKSLFKIDGDYDQMEKHLLNVLKSILG